MLSRSRLPNKEPWASYAVWAGIAIISTVLVQHFTPRYSIVRSYFWTATTAFFAQYLIYFVYAVVIYPRLLSPLRRLPQPSGSGFLTGQWATITSQPTGIPLRKWTNEIPNDGLLRYLHLFNKERLLVTSPKGLAEILTTKSYEFIKPKILRDGVGRILGDGLLLAEGDDHKYQRRSFMPAFNFRHIKELYPVFWQKSQQMVVEIDEELRKNAPNNVQELAQWGSRATLDIIGVAGMGQDFNALSDPNTELNRTYRHIFQPSRAAQILGLLQFIIPSWIVENLPLKRNDDVLAATKLVRSVSRQLIKQKQERLEKKEVLPPDIISVALESGTFSEDQMVDNMMTFLAAGHETTASTFTWALYMMCQHPEVQQKLRNEIHAHIDSLEDSIEDTTIDGMTYLHAVCNEVLRFYSPVPATLRVAEVDTTLLGQFVPKGVTIVLSPWATNFSKALWGEDAETFDPERWMKPGQANSGGAVSNYAFLTFLHGPRSCIGQRFAMAELACLVAAFVGKYEFEMRDPDEKIEIKGGITARPRNVMWLKLKPVEGW